MNYMTAAAVVFLCGVSFCFGQSTKSVSSSAVKTQESRIAEIKKWYGEVQKIGLKNGVTKEYIKNDRFSSESPEIPFTQKVSKYQISSEYEVIQCKYSGYEWSSDTYIYKKAGMIFFVYVNEGAESSGSEDRYYCDSSEKVIQHLYSEDEYGEVKTKNAAVPLDPANPKIQNYIEECLADVNRLFKK